MTCSMLGGLLRTRKTPRPYVHIITPSSWRAARPKARGGARAPLPLFPSFTLASLAPAR